MNYSDLNKYYTHIIKFYRHFIAIISIKGMKLVLVHNTIYK